MELLGREKAASLFEQFPDTTKDVVQNIYSQNISDPYKFDKLIALAEDAKGYMLVNSLTDEDTAKDSLRTMVLGAGEEELIGLLGTLTQAEIKAISQVIRPEVMSVVLNSLYKLNLEVFEKVATSINPKAPMDESISYSEIEQKVSQWLDENKSSSSGAYINYLSELVENMESEATDEIISKVSLLHPDMAEDIRRKIVTFSTFFQLNKASQADILDELSNSEIASLIVGSPVEMKHTFLVPLSAKQQELIKDEIEICESENPAIVKKKFGQITSKIISKLKEYSVSGVLEDMLESQQEIGAPSSLGFKQSA